MSKKSEAEKLASRRAYYDKVQEGIQKPKGEKWIPTHGVDRFAKERNYTTRGPEST